MSALPRQESHIADIRSPKLILFTNSITRSFLAFLHTIYQYAVVHLGITQRVNHLFSTDMLFFWWSRPAWMQSRLFSTTCEFEAVMNLPFSRAFGRKATKMTLLPPLSLMSLPKMNSASTSSGSFSGTRQVMKTYALLLQRKTSQQNLFFPPRRFRSFPAPATSSFFLPLISIFLSSWGRHLCYLPYCFTKLLVLCS